MSGSTGSSPRRPRILFVSHEATRTGAPMFLLHLLRWLRANTPVDFEVLLDRGGPLEAEFAAVAPVRRRAEAEAPGFFRRFELVYSNTCCNGLFLESLPYGDVPVVTHVHELDYGINACGAKNCASVVRHTSHYIACAETVADRLNRRFRIPQDRIRVHYEMIDAGHARELPGAPPGELRSRYRLEPDALVISGCGTVDLRKAPDLFVQLAGALIRGRSEGPPLRFFWIGKTNDVELRSILGHDARRLGLGGQMQFVGELPNPRDLLALSDIFCLPSREDPFPLAMLEAASLGKPVVCFAGAGGAGEFCGAGGGVAVPFLDVAAMAEQCRALLGSASLRKEVGERAAKLVRARFTVEAAAARLWSDLEGILRQPGPAGIDRRSLAEIFASWAPEDRPQPAYIDAYLSRQAARQSARELRQGGKVAESIQVLIRAARAGIATNDPRIVVEALVEIGEDLSSLDAAKARQLLEQAADIARKMGVPLPRGASPGQRTPFVRRAEAAAAPLATVP